MQNNLQSLFEGTSATKPFSLDHQEYRGLTFLYDPAKLPASASVVWDYETGTINCRFVRILQAIYGTIIDAEEWIDAAILLKRWGPYNQWLSPMRPLDLLVFSPKELSDAKTNGYVN